MQLPTLAEYSQKYDHIKFEREDGILQLTMHSGGSDLEWGFSPHQELGGDGVAVDSPLSLVCALPSRTKFLTHPPPSPRTRNQQ